MNMLRFPKRRAPWLTAWGAAYGWPPLFLPLCGDGWRLFEKPLLLADVAQSDVGEGGLVGLLPGVEGVPR